MKIKNWIQRQPVTIHRTALLQDAVETMKQHGIRHLPVMEEDELVGFITESDLRQFSFPSMVEDIPVHQVMVTNPLTIDVNSGIDIAAKLIHDNKIGGLPVLDQGKLAGVITASDLLSAFIEVLGVLDSSIRMDVQVNDEAGGVDDASKVITEQGGEVVNVAMDSHSTRKKVYYFRLENCESGPIVEALEAKGHKVLSVMD